MSNPSPEVVEALAQELEDARMAHIATNGTSGRNYFMFAAERLLASPILSNLIAEAEARGAAKGNASSPVASPVAEIRSLKTAVRIARTELACLLPAPKAARHEWPDQLNDADKQCLTDALDALTAVSEEQ